MLGLQHQNSLLIIFVIPLRANNGLLKFDMPCPEDVCICFEWLSTQKKKKNCDCICNPPRVLCFQMTLGHEFGAGAACLKCKDKCEGFELHFWRFVQLLSSNTEPPQKQV